MAIALQYLEKISVDALIILLIGILFIINYLWDREKLKRYKMEAIRTDGTVLDFDGTSGDIPFPIVEFQLEDGRDVAHRCSHGTNPPIFAKGDKVEILYLPDKPANFIIVSKGAQQLTIAFLLFGVIAIGYAMYSIAKDLHFVD